MSTKSKAREVIEHVQAPHRVVAYVRVSSVGQDHATQRHAIERAHPNVSHWYAEKQSAKTTQRVELQRMLEDARNKKFSTLVCFKLDRLARSGVRDTFAVLKVLRDAGVTLVAVADNITIRPDSEDIASECYVFALGLAAKLEHAAIRDRVAAAAARKKAKGEAWGRPSKTDKHTLKRVHEMKAAGMTMTAIAKELKVSRMSLWRMFERYET